MPSSDPFVTISAADRERLQRIAVAAVERLPEHGDGAWLAGWVGSLLAGLPPDLAERDMLIREIFETTAGTKRERFDEFRRLCRAYERGRWRHDQGRPAMPPSYVGSVDERMFKLFRMTAGEPPLSDRALNRVLASDCFYKRSHRHKMRFSCREF